MAWEVLKSFLLDYSVVIWWLKEYPRNFFPQWSRVEMTSKYLWKNHFIRWLKSLSLNEVARFPRLKVAVWQAKKSALVMSRNSRPRLFKDWLKSSPKSKHGRGRCGLKQRLQRPLLSLPKSFEYDEKWPFSRVANLPFDINLKGCVIMDPEICALPDFPACWKIKLSMFHCAL